MTCYFYAIDHLVLADAAMLNKLSPFVALVAAWAFLAERPTARTMAAVALAFAGALLVIKPRFDLTVLPALAGFGSALFAGCAYTIVRSLRDREAPETIIFVFSLVTVVLLLPPVAVGFSAPRPLDLLWVACIGVAAAAGQFSLTYAFRHGPAAEVALYSYMTIVFAGLIGLVVWGETPDVASAAGAAAILAAAGVVYSGARGRSTAAKG
ncbi:MAG: DMT family transporter [Acidobacteriota bacterium]|nr:DMT family transporter [Acidobacteriota bacterium]